MNILENELVQKYFGCEEVPLEQRPVLMSWKILHAMQEPIRKGDRVLQLRGCFGDPQVAEVQEEIADSRWDGANEFHAYWLRLPYQFQKKECGHRCHEDPDCEWCSVCKDKHEPVQKRECECSCTQHGQKICSCKCHEPQRDEVKCDCGGWLTLFGQG